MHNLFQVEYGHRIGKMTDLSALRRQALTIKQQIRDKHRQLIDDYIHQPWDQVNGGGLAALLVDYFKDEMYSSLNDCECTKTDDTLTLNIRMYFPDWMIRNGEKEMCLDRISGFECEQLEYEPTDEGMTEASYKITVKVPQKIRARVRASST